ncbi:TetR/AcrR family transcriptional regulator [Lactobacillus delbrueckii]|uniref:TetR/AcrR family transcriptional regulator n=1 Tax=Lactobacillus delbrueckii TaxID=1584 RepID=UPI00178059E8|nr:TetR/AcrR family transcriptional regulator [Lactobacillus delbrueckii]MBD5834816.1 TetR/AcrR family transcriptional regulator [Lactobacillus delbrueckii]
MVKATFDNLSKDKQDRVTEALLKEFSAHTLASAQVARIVKEARIARGTFYKYFEDLTDAYQYLFKLAMRDLHTGLTGRMGADELYQMTKDFVTKATGSQYYNLIRLHYAANEALLPSSRPNKQMPACAWAAMALSHEAIKEALLDPDKADFYLDREHEVLEKLFSQHK